MALPDSYAALLVYQSYSRWSQDIGPCHWGLGTGRLGSNLPLRPGTTHVTRPLLSRWTEGSERPAGSSEGSMQEATTLTLIFWDVSDCFRWFQIVSDGFRLFQMVSDCFRWFQIVSDDFRLLHPMRNGNTWGLMIVWCSSLIQSAAKNAALDLAILGFCSFDTPWLAIQASDARLRLSFSLSDRFA